MLVAEARARGIRVVPSDPGPEFRPVARACDLRPTRCGECAVGTCPYGQVAGLEGAAEAPRLARSRLRSAKVRRTMLELARELMHPTPPSDPARLYCTTCGTAIDAPDWASCRVTGFAEACRTLPARHRGSFVVGRPSSRGCRVGPSGTYGVGRGASDPRPLLGGGDREASDRHRPRT